VVLESCGRGEAASALGRPHVDLPPHRREARSPSRRATRSGGVSEEVAGREPQVFAELHPLRRFVWRPAPTRGRAAPASSLPGRPEAGPSDRDGRTRSAAFASYAPAAGKRRTATRAQLILLANCQIGLHEQTRLQEDIEGAMNAPVAASSRRVGSCS